MLNLPKMSATILVSALLLVCPVIALITLPNGFQFDETKYLKRDSRASVVPEKCETMYNGCSNDCSSKLYCDSTGTVTDKYECGSYQPYCVKNVDPYPECSQIYPMEGPCFTKATNYFVCSDDGTYPDPSDCSKYHVCNGSAHYIESCPPNHIFTYDKLNPYTMESSYTYPGNGEYKCRFGTSAHGQCGMCEPFYCDGMANQFAFRYDDSFHYVYCIEIGTTKRAIMFKCPQGTRHFGSVNATTNDVDCIPSPATP